MKTFGLDLQHFETKKEPKLEVRKNIKKVTIPLKGGFGSSLSPVVDVGDEVKAGKIVGRDDDSLSTPVHASVTGKVVDIVELDYYHEETRDPLEFSVKGVRIERTGDGINGEGVNWEKEKPKNIRELLYLGGLTSLGQTGIPTEFNSSWFSPEDVQKVLVNGVKTEPFLHHLIDFNTELESYTTGLEILARAFPKSQIHYVLDQSTLDSLSSLRSSQRIKVHSVKNKSQLSNQKMLARKILGTENLDDGGYLLDHGVLALPEITPLAVYRAVVEGEALVRNRFSLGGPGVEDKILEVPIGTTVEDAVEPYAKDETNSLSIMGGPLAGAKIDDPELPVGKEFDSLVKLNKPSGSEVLAWLRPGLSKNSYSRAFLSALAPGRKKKADSGLHGEERPCISCGYCNDVCPVDILPYQLYQTHVHDLVDEVNRLQPQRCVDCGLCSYVCPSKLPLSNTIKEAKKTQPGESHNYVEYEEVDGKLVPTNSDYDQGRGEES